MEFTNLFIYFSVQQTEKQKRVLQKAKRFGVCGGGVKKEIFWQKIKDQIFLNESVCRISSRIMTRNRRGIVI